MRKPLLSVADRGFVAFAVSLTVLLIACAQPSLARKPHAVLDRAFQAMGGRDRLKAVSSIEYTAVGERDMVEQSERPTGPYFIDHFWVHEFRDLLQHRTRIEQTDEAYAADQWWLQQPPQQPQVTVINDDVAAVPAKGGFAFGGAFSIQQNGEQFAFGPERLLMTAAAASDVKQDPDVVLHGVLHHVLRFGWQGAPCTLFINADTGLPWQVTFSRAYPYQVFLHAWGDVTTRITYSAWTLEPSGIVYPREWAYERVDLPDTRMAIVRLRFNVALDSGQLTVPRNIYNAHHAKLRPIDDIVLGFGGNGPPHELAPGITQYPGSWNVAFIKQTDGAVVIEAPLSARYAQQAFDAARRTYGVPVKAVITTSDSWPHIAGVRQAVADGISIYALDLNEPILKRLIAAPHRMEPDDLERHPHAAHFTFVDKPMSVGTGPNRLEIVPYRTATGERQMMVYFPERKLLYTSDLFAPDGNGGWFTPEYLHEAIGAIEREHLIPDTIFGMHYDATPYSKIVDALRSFQSSKCDRSCDGQQRTASRPA